MKSGPKINQLRQEALEKGLLYYEKYHAKCGTSKRYTNHNGCVACKEKYDKAHRAEARIRDKERYYNKSNNRKNWQRNHSYQKKYGITIEKYNKMYEEQKGRCYLCDIHQDDLTKKLAVDHNHETGQIRKLLCFNCNHGIGAFKENINTIERALNYLKDKEWIL